MSSLVNNFLFRPVIRRFSRSSGTLTDDNPDAARNIQGTPATTQHQLPINELDLDEGEKEMQSDATDEPIGGGLFGQPIVSSPLGTPTEENTGTLEPDLYPWNRSNTEPTHRNLSRVPLRLASLRSERHRIDDDTSENSSFGTPSGFQTSSSISIPLNDVRMASVGEESNRMEDEYHTRQRNRSLPEDDGMSDLRRRIVRVQGMDISPEEKARLMHDLLTEGYSQSRAKPIPRAQSPMSITSLSTTPGSPCSSGIWPMSITPNSSPPRTAVFKVSQEDLKPTFAPPRPRPVEDEEHTNLEIDENDGDDEPVLGCPHYRRNVKLQCSQCYGWYTCRFCHDEVEDHALIRKDTKNMLCMLCGSPQAAGQTCIQCGVQAAWYYCSVCKLWDNDPCKSIYHCDDCGICRVGRGLGKDYIHCKTCGVCMSIAIENSHKCIERSTDCDCPICGDYMFSSPQTVVFMKCGHSIHHKCYYEHMQTSYKCPICSKSIVNMETQFRNLDRAIDNQPMPPQFQDTKAMVHCNDCYAKSAVKYHWLGLKCAICDSYNTAQLQILSDPDSPDSDTDTMVTTESQVDDQSVAMDPLPPSTNQFVGPSSALQPPISRRHSNNLPIPIPARFAPYPILQRITRSVSPSRPSFGPPLSSHVESQRNSAYDSDGGEEDEVDFWGYSSGLRLRDEGFEEEQVGECGDDDDEDDDEDEDEDGDDEDDDGDEEEDRMELFGHR